MNKKKLKPRDTGKSKKILVIVIMIAVILSLLFIGFSFFSPSVLEGTTYHTTGSATDNSPSIVYTDTSNGINLTGTYPMIDEEGLTLDPYTFNVLNNEDIEIICEIYLQTESGNAIANNLVSVSLDSSSPTVLSSNPTGNPSSGYSYSYKIGTATIAANQDKDFSLKAWFNSSGTIETVQNKNWYGKIFVKARFNKSGVAKIQNLVSGEPTNSTDVITKDAPAGSICTNTLAYDGTTDNNLRYVGSNPCNYVTFNGETAGWRIVGIMNNVDDGTGKKETRIKITRANLLGSYSWDTSDSSVNSGDGVSDWTQADLKNELNGDYLNTSLNANTNWYNGNSNKQTAMFDYTKRLSAGAQELIGDAKWYLGGFTNTIANLIPSTMYTKERGTETYSTSHTCNDGACPRATEWTGKVALIYPSDYGYATAGGQEALRGACIGTLSTYNSSSGETWQNSSYSDCKNNDWIPIQWSLTSISSYASHSFAVYTGIVNYTNTYSSFTVCPAVYLKSNVTISGGNGTETDPYILE